MTLPLKLRGVTATTVQAADERFHAALDFGFADGVHYLTSLKYDHENEAQMAAERVLAKLNEIFDYTAERFDHHMPTLRFGSEGAQ